MFNCAVCQCPHGLVPHCYPTVSGQRFTRSSDVSMPSRASASLLRQLEAARAYGDVIVSMPSRASTSLLLGITYHIMIRTPIGVNALTGLYLISTSAKQTGCSVCYCVNALTGLYLISTYVVSIFSRFRAGVNALTGLYLISTLRSGKTPEFKEFMGVNALTGLYLIST